MNRTTKLLSLCLAASMLASCTQVRHRSKGLAIDQVLRSQEPERERTRSDRDERGTRWENGPGKYYGDTRARLQLIREDIEFEDFDIDFDDGSDGRLRDFERDRTGFRAEFGRGANGGFFQVFSEKVNAPSLLVEEFTSYGIGGGVIGAPVVGTTQNVEFLVPFKFEANVSVGSENVGAFDQDLWYAESSFELGFGARWLGLQSSTGIMVNSVAGLFDSDLPTSPALGGGAEISGTNFGAFFDVLYKHPNVPLVARARAIAGDIQGVMLSFGFAF